MAPFLCEAGALEEAQLSAYRPARTVSGDVVRDQHAEHRLGNRRTGLGTYDEDRGLGVLVP